MKIYTLTLNPAYDVHAVADAFSACRENFAAIFRRDAGGKGVNISRALCAGDTPNTAVIVIGKENGSEFKNDLAQFGLDALYLEKEGRIRENLTLHHGSDETRISFSGFCVDDSLITEVAEMMDVDEDTYVTFTGSIPSGMSRESAKAFLVGLKERGAKIVVDCRSFDLQDIRDIAPWIVKPNQQEVSQWFGTNVDTIEKAGAYAQKLSAMGVTNAMISMGELGAVLYSDGLYVATAPKLCPVSTIGAGDSSIAGFLCATTKGLDKGDCLRHAVAFGSAACLTEGTQPPKNADIHKILRDIKISEGR